MYKVLLADDLALTLAAEKECLEGRNLKVFVTTSALAIEKLAQVFKPDIVVVDYEMPEMTGDQVCRVLRDHPQTAGIPVLVLSIHDDEETVRRCEEAGAVGFIRKADGREALLEGVAKVLGVPRRRHVRVSCQVIAGIDDSGESFAGMLGDISTSGTLLRAERQMALGTPLHMRFKLPGSGTEIHVLGEIVRRETLIGTGFSFGIQFLETDAGAGKVLRDFIGRTI